MKHNASVTLEYLLILCGGHFLVSGVLVFDPTALLKDELIPSDARVGSVIYRLRVSDTAFDYPLSFGLRLPTPTAVELKALNCTKFNSVCQANVILSRRLEVGRFYDFVVEVRNQRGQSAATNCSFQATNATTPIETIFPGAPALLYVSENATRNTEIGFLIARGNPDRMKAVYMELYGSPKFGIHQRLVSQKDAQGSIVLLNSLDYEIQTVHHLTILANDPWSNTKEDTRNIAGWPLVVAVLDEQDTPPIFTIKPLITRLNSKLKPGDIILRVHAEDGDRGNPRPIRYYLPKTNNTYSKFFDISESTGELKLTKPVSDIMSSSNSGQAILLNVTAEEVRSSLDEAPSQSTSIQLAFILPDVTFGQPTFGSNEYHALLDENAPIGTTLDLLQAEINTQPGDIVALELLNNNGTFDITPSIVEGHSRFRITVHDNRLLDYEARHYVECYIVAKEIGKGNYSARSKLVVVLNDVNDNPPQFVKSPFEANIQEHAPVGTTVLLVEATDVDREPGSKIRYNSLSGRGSGLFALNPESGLITVADSSRLDAESMPIIKLIVEAADENGDGLSATAEIVITLLDINDQTPEFDKDVYEFILNPDGTGFTTQAFIRATDLDVSSPNNIVHYELINGTESLTINELSGEVFVRGTWRSEELVSIRARAYDEGIPILSSECEIRIYPPEAKSRKMVFILPGKSPSQSEAEHTIRALTGGRVTIDEIRPFVSDEPGAAYVTREKGGDRSVVVATVYYTKDSVVDLNRIQSILDSRSHEGQQQNEGQTVTREKEQTRIEQGSSGSLLWLVILLIILAILAAIILILCCICRPCPLYIPPKRRKIKSTEIVEKLIRGSGQGRESKSVQVAEWFGRNEKWAKERERAQPVAVGIDQDIDSLRMHEMERGSDRGGIRLIRHHQTQEVTRDPMYIREGNADILRLVTRAGEEPNVIPVAFMEQQYLPDSGKDILMRRFIDQQQAEAARVAQFTLPNAVSKLQTEQEFLEASLRQQNALLRQLILDRERDLRLETQSLPAGTQTDQNAATQTEPQYLRPPRRRVQSDYDLSDASDEEIAIVRARAKRRNHRMKHRIKTPIQEESEVEVVEKPRKVKHGRSPPDIKQTRTSDMRQKKATSETSTTTRSKSSRSGLKKEVLNEISASLEHSDENSYIDIREISNQAEWYSADSLDDDSPRSPPRQKYHSETDLRGIEPDHKEKKKSKLPVKKSQSHNDLASAKGSKEKKVPKRTSRYMEWYTKNKQAKTQSEQKKPEGDGVAVPAVEARYLKQTESSSRKIVNGKNTAGPEHPLLQHSEHRFEAHYPKRKPEEDTDSGIVLNKPEMAQKKSVFTIAYNDVQTRQLRPQSSTTP
ncbi:cadherin-86C [Cylas formicarius]|uniref:cadherin-86C n=1 Tax=Cylas formicarius TaxID=197179 RepID=UPI002958D585|nr:cadherin-86C [Cylas formicarius]